MKKEYNIFKIRSNYIPFGVCMLVLMAVLSVFIFTKDVIELSLYNSPIVIDMDADSGAGDIEKLKIFLSSDALVETSSIEVIDKASSKDILGQSIDSLLINRMNEMEIFHDLILFRFKSDVKDKHQRNEFLALVRDLEKVNEVNAAAESVIKPNNWLEKLQVLFLPIIIMISVVMMSIIAFLIKQNIQSNTENWKTLILLGREPKKLLQDYWLAVVRVLFRAWIFAVVLFLIVFYLMIYRFNVSFYDIGPVKLIFVLVVPLLIYIFSVIVTSILILRKA